MLLTAVSQTGRTWNSRDSRWFWWTPWAHSTQACSGRMAHRFGSSMVSCLCGIEFNLLHRKTFIKTNNKQVVWSISTPKNPPIKQASPLLLRKAVKIEWMALVVRLHRNSSMPQLQQYDTAAHHQWGYHMAGSINRGLQTNHHQQHHLWHPYNYLWRAGRMLHRLSDQLVGWQIKLFDQSIRGCCGCFVDVRQTSDLGLILLAHLVQCQLLALLSREIDTSRQDGVGIHHIHVYLVHTQHTVYSLWRSALIVDVDCCWPSRFYLFEGRLKWLNCWLQ